jgi:hypothetical protein
VSSSTRAHRRTPRTAAPSCGRPCPAVAAAPCRGPRILQLRRLEHVNRQAYAPHSVGRAIARARASCHAAELILTRSVPHDPAQPEDARWTAAFIVMLAVRALYETPPFCAAQGSAPLLFYTLGICSAAPCTAGPGALGEGCSCHFKLHFTLLDVPQHARAYCQALGPYLNVCIFHAPAQARRRAMAARPAVCRASSECATRRSRSLHSRVVTTAQGATSPPPYAGSLGCSLHFG